MNWAIKDEAEAPIVQTAWQEAKGVATQINELHYRIYARNARALADSIEIGRMLSEQKDKLVHGHYLNWLNKHINFSYETARNYQKLYDYREEIKSQNIVNSSSAYRLIQRIKRQEKLEENVKFTPGLDQAARVATSGPNRRSTKSGIVLRDPKALEVLKNKLLSSKGDAVDWKAFEEHLEQFNAGIQAICNEFQQWLDLSFSSDFQRLHAYRYLSKECQRIANRIYRKSNDPLVDDYGFAHNYKAIS